MNKKICFAVKKLIRDNLPTILAESGIKIIWQRAEDDRYLHLLKQKLIEEAKEVEETYTKSDLLEELGDVIEVITVIAAQSGYTLEDVINAAESKKREKGGFTKRVYADHMIMEETNPMIEKYLAKPDKYPVIQDENK